MCGIAGIVRLDRSTLEPGTGDLLRQMGQRIAHRGPDDEQVLLEGSVGMVFRRLSIVDLEAGAQPMCNEDGSLVLMVNGEIYNHHELRGQLEQEHCFRTRSDSEIILHLYEERGVDFLKLLNGMFALALWDKRERRLLLARDRLGIKPLFYAVTSRELVFGSELKAIFVHPAVPRQFDWESGLGFYWDRRYVRPERPLPSFFKGIEQLKGGHVLTADLHGGASNVESYWALTPPEQDEWDADTRGAGDIKEEFRVLFDDAVHMRLMGDVELGVFLSGGIDSTSVATVAAEQMTPHTFTVFNQGTFAVGDVRGAHVAAKHLGLPNHQVKLDFNEHPPDADTWRRLLWLTESPMLNGDMLYKYFLHGYARRERPDLKIILLGQGSDEFLAAIGERGSTAAPGKMSWDGFMASMADLEKFALSAQSGGRISPDFGVLPQSVLTRDFLLGLGDAKPYRHPWMVHCDFYLWQLQMYNLWHEDRTAAGHGIENRLPFLDHRIPEFVLRIPPRLYSDLLWDKNLLRSAMRGRLPEAVRSIPKGNFYMPDASAADRLYVQVLTSDGGALIDEAFSPKGGRHDVVDHDSVLQLFDLAVSDPQPQLVEGLRVLTNLALLDRLARDEAPPSTEPQPYEPVRIPIDDFDAEKGALEQLHGVGFDRGDSTEPTSK